MTNIIIRVRVVMVLVTREATIIKNHTRIVSKRVTIIKEVNTTNTMIMGMVKQVKPF